MLVKEKNQVQNILLGQNNNCFLMAKYKIEKEAKLSSVDLVVHS